MFKSVGVLKYSGIENPDRLVLEVDRDLYLLYRALMPNWIKLNGQRYSPHISVVRKIIPPNLEFWGKHEDEVVEFEYSNYIHTDGRYYWINAFSYRLEEIRSELGLELYGSNHLVHYNQTWHITIGNTKLGVLS